MCPGQQHAGLPPGYYPPQGQEDAAPRGWIPPDGSQAELAPAQDWYRLPSGAPSSNFSIQVSSLGASSYPTTGASNTPESPEVKGDKSKRRKRKGADPSPPLKSEKERDGEKDKDKRAKTGRACDECRSKKIRCDILSTEQRDRDGAPICAHCKQCDLECTFFLPISETRFKKRKAAEETGAGDAGLNPNSSSIHGGATSPREKGREGSRTDAAPSSLSSLLQPSVLSSSSEAYDLREHNRWDISDDGNGHVKVSVPSSRNGSLDDAGDLSKGHNRLNRPMLSSHTMSLLVNAYFDHLVYLFPVISKADFMSKKDVNPLLLYAVCGMGATRREFPRDVFAGIRGIINGLIRANDILSDARFENVQALLILSQAGDLHAQPTAPTASACLIRMATATRMAQDLGLHRESTSKPETAEDVAFLELRRRVWASCVIMDRWYGASLGVPLLIDLLDCDVLVPAPIEVVPGVNRGDWKINTSFLALSEHLKLSILVGRVLKTIYSPTGLTRASDADLYGLLNDITSWRENLPQSLRFTGTGSSHAAGLLHLCHAALQFLFWRVFMRVQYICPPHLTFKLNEGCCTDMVQWSSESLRWLAANDEVLDTLFIFSYTATSCALIQYHTWVRRRTPESLEMLKLVRDTATRWTEVVQPDQMSIRRKTCETMTLLYSIALKTNPGPENSKDAQTEGDASVREGDGSGQGLVPQEAQVDVGPVVNVGPGRLDGVQNGVPVNPSINDNQLLEEDFFGGYSGVDSIMLDDLPMSQFDFPSWEQYFQALNQNPGGS